jgi:Transposase and inactivated derivatives
VDESGFSLSPILGTTWAEVGKPPVLRETYSRRNQSGLGFISATPNGRKMKFHFTIMDGSCVTEDFVFWLIQLHHHFQKKVIIVWDRLSAHIAAQNFLERTHPDWFVFEYFPSYSPELNPVEQCWQWMKNVFLVNYVAKDNPELHIKTLEAASYINTDPKLLPAFFHHAKLQF